MNDGSSWNSALPSTRNTSAAFDVTVIHLIISELDADPAGADTNEFIELETRPDDPYSVQLNYIVKDGKLYIDPAEGRTWFEHIKADPRVRVRLGDQIYPLNAVLAGRPGELEGFDPERFVYRLDPRD